MDRQFQKEVWEARPQKLEEVRTKVTVVFCDGVAENADMCLQTISAQQMHREEQTMMLKSRGRTRDTGQDLALGHSIFSDLEEESEVAMGILLVRILCRCRSSWSCSGQTPWR